MTPRAYAHRSMTTTPATLTPATMTMLDDVRESVRQHRVWRFIGWREVARQYERTLLGVFWIPLNVLLHVGTLGLVYSVIFDGGKKYFAYFAMSYSIWKAFGLMLGSAASLWPSSEKYITHLPAPISLFVAKGVYKMVIVMALSLPVGVILAIATGARPGWMVLLAVPGVIIYVLNILWIMTVLSLICLRSRDVRQLVPNLLFIIFLTTPIMWQVKKLGDHQWVALVNPLYHMIELVRAPVLGQMPSPLSWGVGIGMAVVGNAFGFTLLAVLRRRIALWL